MAEPVRYQIRLTGRVQGIGCRPWVYRIAQKFSLAGFIENDTQGVTIEIQGQQESLRIFCNVLQSSPDKPALLTINSFQYREIPIVAGQTDFVIAGSRLDETITAGVCQDIATCKDCLEEMYNPDDFRYRYPFINCTQCGPRYSIVKTIPYDRSNTTMSGFEMCSRCRQQYKNISNRRFHAQPVACPECGPKITLLEKRGNIIETDSDRVISRTAELLLKGNILAIKGIGGFHLAVNALDDEAVKRLRQRKRREAKPFALMAGRIEIMEKYAYINSAAKELLTAPESPIVLLHKKEPNAAASSVAEGTNSFGFMLPYAPLHHLLFAEPGIEVLVMTSANLSDEPLICDNQLVLEQLGNVADYFLVHDRPIYRQVDDSVAHVIDGKPAFLRRSRGYVPDAILRSEPVKQDIFSAGADLKNTFCFAKANQYIVSEHIGDLEKPTVYRHYIRSIEHLAGLFEVQPRAVVCDLHPGYFSTQYAREYAQKRGIGDFIQVQHHWAHAASVMAEYNLDGKVLALVADGTGYGTDGAVWGCECLISSLTDFQRLGHLEYYPLAGGDMASQQPIRPLLGLAKTADIEIPKELLLKIEPNEEKINIICQQIDKSLATVPTSSLGRLFDAAAALIGLGNFNHFEAQLPMAMEAAADPNESREYPVEIRQNSDGALLLAGRTILVGLLEDIKRGQDIQTISARFHNTICRGLFEFAIQARNMTGISDIALSGGVFCNRYLAGRLKELLQKNDFRVFFKQRIPTNDGGISLGQAAICAAKLEIGLKE